MSELLHFFGSFILTGALVGALAGFSYGKRALPAMQEARQERTASADAPLSSAPSPFERIALTARAAYVYDAATGAVLFEKNADAQLPLASLTKVMTATTALSLAPRFALVPVGPGFRPYGDMENTAPIEQWPLASLLSFALTASSNEAAFAAASAAGSLTTQSASPEENLNQFIDAMNKEAAALHLSSTYFLNTTGLDESTDIAGAYGSAHDVSALMMYAFRTHPELFDATTASSFLFTEDNGSTHYADNTDKIVNDIPLLRASKTGFTDLAGGNLSIIFDAGVAKPIVVTVLGSTLEGRFADVKALAAVALQFLQKDAVR